MKTSKKVALRHPTDNIYTSFPKAMKHDMCKHLIKGINI